MKNEDPRRVKTAETSFRIIEIIQSLDGATLSELAAELELAKSTIHRHVHTLEDMGYVTREGREFFPSLKYLELGEYVKNRRPEFQLAKQTVEDLASETGELTQFEVEEHGMGVFVHRAHGDQAVRTDPGIGTRVPLHVNACGKSILAFLPRERVEEVISRHGLTEFTDNTITDRMELEDELEQIRERGFSFNLEERVTGMNAIAAPVRYPSGQVIGSIGFGGPSHRMKADRLEDEYSDLILGVANQLELNIVHS